MLDPAGVQMLRTQHLPSSSSSAGTAGACSTQDAERNEIEEQPLALQEAYNLGFRAASEAWMNSVFT